MKNIAIIQARLGSQRFPNKVIQKLWNDKTVLEVLIDRLKLSKNLDMIVVATTNESEDLAIVELCNSINIPCWNKGSKDSALNSVYQTIQILKKEWLEEPDFNLIDITADCPFIDPKQLDEMLEWFHYSQYDYLSNCMIRSFPIGFDIQIYESFLLEKIYNIIQDNNHRMHTGWNIWSYSKELQDEYFDLKYGNLCAKDNNFKPTWRIVLDYETDLILLKNIINYFDRIDFTYQEVIKYLLENPELLEINKNNKQKIAGFSK
jgi:spore coat polysaccharide biosynthesis protein SpsF (cytidylyltransferase family)